MRVKSKLLNMTFKIIFTIVIVSAAMLYANTAYGAYPSSLDLTIVSANQIQLSWTDTITGETGYKVDRKIDTGDFAEIAALAANTTTYTDYSVLSGHLYTYRIRSFSPNNITNIHTDEVSVTTGMIISPVSLSVKASSTSELDLTWSYPESKTYDTVVERRNDSSNDSSNAWVIIATVQKGTSSYSDINLPPNSKYYYRVKAVWGPHVYSVSYPNDSTGISAFTMFDAPSEFYGFASAPTQIYVLWNDIPYEASYTIERKTGITGTYSTVASVPANTTFWLDSGVTANTRYFYRIKAVNGLNISNYSQEILIASVPLTEPSDLTAVSTSNSEIDLEWKDNSDSESGFEIWRKIGTASNWELYTTVGRNTQYFADTDLTSNKQYFYRVRGIVAHSYIYSSFTPAASSWTLTMEPPQNLQATIVSASEVILDWKDSSTNESGFTIERKTGDGEWIEIASLPANTTKYDDKNVVPGVQYHYRVKVFDNNYYNSEAFSEETEVVTGPPQGPTSLTLTPVSSSQIRLVWKDNSSDEMGFIIERRSFNGTKYSEIARTNSGETSYINNGLSAATKYYYRVKAFNKTGSSPYSNEIFAATKANVTFKDLKGDIKEKQIIENLASRGIFKSRTDGLFGPEDKMTRGEFMYTLVKALGLKMSASGSFSDVKKGSTYYNEIMIADKAGIIIRNGNSYFYPNKYLTREDLAVFITRAMKAVNKPLESFDPSIMDQFDDTSSISDSTSYYLISVFGESIMTGKVAGSKFLIAPIDIVTRKEAALTIYNIIDR